MNSVYVIGIAGGSGSGKSTFARRLTERFSDSVALVSCDNYYRAHDDIPRRSAASSTTMPPRRWNSTSW